jgi:uncharacterized protein involved in outer membrane biogenesis
VVVVVLAGAVAWIANADLAPMAARFASDALERPVTIGVLDLGWQDGVTLELRDLRVANASWSETREMASIEAVSAVIDAAALWRGVLRYEKLRVGGLRAALERGPGRVGNWEFSGDSLPAPGGGVVPKKRSGFPILLDARLQDALITYRTSSGQILEIDLDEVTIETTGDDRPVSSAAAGAYNGVAARIQGTGESFDAFRDTSRPYGLGFGISTETEITTATFDGTLTKPLDFDGVDGRLAVDASDTAELARMFDAEIGITFPLKIAGRMTRQADDWRLDGAEGVVAGNAFAGGLQLVEGGPGEPDDVAADLDFAAFDIGPLLGDGAAAAGGYREAPITLGEAPGINLDLDLRMAAFIYGKTRLADAALVGRVTGRQVTVERLAFALAGGGLTASGSSEPVAGGGRLSVAAALDGIDAAIVAQMLGAAPGDVAGTIEGRATLDMTGRTVTDALGASRGHAVIAMSEGRIARAILEKAASDLRTLFRSREGTARIHCVLGILDLADGIGRVKLLKLRTAEATLNGGGTVNLVDERIDMTFMTAPDSTGFFALDVPFRVRGSLENPSVEPQLGGGPKPGEFPVAEQSGAKLPAELNQLVQDNPCR